MRIKIEFPAMQLDERQRAQRLRQRRLIFGWALVCTVDGEEHYDCENTHVPQDEMFHAAMDYFMHRRVGKHNHEGPLAGTVDYSLPLTTNVAGIYGIKSQKTGWMIGWRPLDDSVFDEFEKGNLRGFSINGWANHEPSTRGHVLRNLHVDEISVVDNPGQPLATIALIKNVDDLFAELGLPVLE